MLADHLFARVAHGFEKIIVCIQDIAVQVEDNFCLSLVDRIELLKTVPDRLMIVGNILGDHRDPVDFSGFGPHGKIGRMQPV